MNKRSQQSTHLETLVVAVSLAINCCLFVAAYSVCGREKSNQIQERNTLSCKRWKKSLRDTKISGFMLECEIFLDMRSSTALAQHRQKISHCLIFLTARLSL